MASFAESILANAQADGKPAQANLVGSFTTGAELALNQEKLFQAQAALQQKQQEIQMAKFDKVNTYLETGAKLPEGKARTAYYNGFFPQAVQALGVADKIDPNSLKMAQAEPLVFTAIKSKLQKGEITNQEVARMYADPDYMAQRMPELLQFGAGLAPAFQAVVDSNPDELAKAEQTATNTETQRQTVAAQNYRQRVDISEEANKAVARGTGDEFVKYNAIGGSAGMTKTEEALSEAIRQFKSGEVKTGRILENLPLGGNTNVMARTNKPLKALQDMVLSTQNIKALSGDPNPTEKQIDAINSRILDPAAPNKTNIIKLQAELKRVRAERLSKEASFSRAGLMGGTTPTPKEQRTESATKPQAGTPQTTSGSDRASFAAERIKQTFPNFSSATAEQVNQLKTKLTKQFQANEVTSILQKLGLQ